MTHLLFVSASFTLTALLLSALAILSLKQRQQAIKTARRWIDEEHHESHS